MNELSVVETKPLTAVEIRAQVNLIQEVMKAVMKRGVHYDVVPGCGDKPTLLKPGAEKLAATFHLAIDPEVSDLSTEDEVRFRIRAKVTHPSYGFVGCGVGEASSGEAKWKWRAATCQEEFDSTPEDRKREVWKRGYQEKPAYTVKQVRTEPADLRNTVLKMAKKRALVDAILTCTAASDIFAQDIEDLPDELRDETGELAAPAKPTVQAPQRKSQAIGNGQDWRQMPAKFNGLCKGGCDQEIKTGTTIWYSPSQKIALCTSCYDKDSGESV